MKRALISYGVGPHEEYLEIARPSFERFATRHGYDLILQQAKPCPLRPPSWWKVPAIHDAFNRGYEEVLFLGADLVIIDSSKDLKVPDGKWQALVAHNTDQGEVPNADMWFLRRPMIPYLELIWGMEQHIDHGWWEQRALIELMGYEGEASFKMIDATELYERTHFLDQGWNVHIWDRGMTPDTPVRIQHATMWPDRAAIMREWAQVAI